jgi:hypothetical protein
MRPGEAGDFMGDSHRGRPAGRHGRGLACRHEAVGEARRGRGKPGVLSLPWHIESSPSQVVGRTLRAGA